MAICKTCGKKYSRWVTPVSAKGVCAECFNEELQNEPEMQPLSNAPFLENATTKGASVPPKPPPVLVSLRSDSSATGGEAPNRMFLYIPIGRLVAMSIVSGSLYDAYWIYRNWRYLKERDGLRIWPFWRAIFGIFFIYSLLETIKTDPETNRIVPARFSPGKLATGWIILVLIGNLAARAPDAVVNFIGILLSAPTFCFLIPVQRHINALNEALPIRPPYYPWSVGHIVFLVLGVTFWLLMLVGLTQ